MKPYPVRKKAKFIHASLHLSLKLAGNPKWKKENYCQGLVLLRSLKLEINLNRNVVDLRLVIHSFPAFFDLLISLGPCVKCMKNHIVHYFMINVVFVL